MTPEGPGPAADSSLPLQWDDLFDPAQRRRVADVLLAYARERRWFRGKARHPRAGRVADLIPLAPGQVVAIIDIDYDVGPSDRYAIPLAAVKPDGGGEEGMQEVAPESIIDGLRRSGFAADAFLDLIRHEASASSEGRGEIRGEPTRAFAELATVQLPAATIPDGEQTNSSATFGDRVLLKIYRQLTEGPSPELEMGRFLNRHGLPGCAPRVLGALTYRSPDGATFSLGIAHEFVGNDGDAFSGAVAALRAYLVSPGAPGSGSFRDRATTLGRRTADLHRALAAAGDGEPDFVPESLSAGDRAGLAARAQAMWREQADALRAIVHRLDPRVRRLAEGILAPATSRSIAERLASFGGGRLDVVKTRTHGDLHLGQVLMRGDDFMIIDFEGEPGRPLSERRAKSSPVRDVMGMVRSFAYVPEVVLRGHAEHHGDGDGHGGGRAAHWRDGAIDAYLRGYLTSAAGAAFLPEDGPDLQRLLGFYELEKVIYELAYELNNRPDWVDIPLRGLARLAAVEVDS